MFKPGKSGNPAGRPPLSDTVCRLRKLILSHGPDVVAKLVELALEGDTGAARVLLDRIMPTLKPVQIPKPLPVDYVEGDLSGQASAVFGALFAGRLDVDTAKMLLDGLVVVARLKETDELARRIAALEAK